MDTANKILCAHRDSIPKGNKTLKFSLTDYLMN